MKRVGAITNQKFLVKSGYECALKFLYSDSSSPSSSVLLNPSMWKKFGIYLVPQKPGINNA